MVRIRAFALAILALSGSLVLASAEVIGFFQAGADRNGIVIAPKGSTSGFGPVEIALIGRGPAVARRMSLPNGQWRVEGDRVRGLPNLPKGLSGLHVAVNAAGGAFYLPPFGSTFFLGGGREAVIYFVERKSAPTAISLPIQGGEIKAVKIGSDGLDLLIFDRKSKRLKRGDGRELFGVSPSGENILVRVTRTKAAVVRRLSSDDPRVFWWEMNQLFHVDEIGLKLEPVSGEASNAGAARFTALRRSAEGDTTGR